MLFRVHAQRHAHVPMAALPVLVHNKAGELTLLVFTESRCAAR